MFWLQLYPMPREALSKASCHSVQQINLLQCLGQLVELQQRVLIMEDGYVMNTAATYVWQRADNFRRNDPCCGIGRNRSARPGSTSPAVPVRSAPLDPL